MSTLARRVVSQGSGKGLRKVHCKVLHGLKPSCSFAPGIFRASVVPPQALLLRSTSSESSAIKQTAGSDGGNAGKLTSAQRRKVFLAAAVPGLGFGFMDNFIMIIAGDWIEQNLLIGLAPMVAAGFGNMLSDIVGSYTAGAVETGADRLGFGEPDLSAEQEASSSVKSSKRHGSAFGIAIGCLLGMFPLLFIGYKKTTHLCQEDIDLYNSLFEPHGIGIEESISLLGSATRRQLQDGDELLPPRHGMPKVFLLISGDVRVQFEDNEYLYSGLESPKTPRSAEAADEHLIQRGCVLGGNRVLRSLVSSKDVKDQLKWRTHHTTMHARGHLELLEWDFDELRELMKDDRDLERAFANIVHHNLLKHRKTVVIKAKDSMREHYRNIVATAIADEVVNVAERKFTDLKRATWGISLETHKGILAEFGWSAEEWDRGRKQSWFDQHTQDDH